MLYLNNSLTPDDSIWNIKEIHRAQHNIRSFIWFWAKHVRAILNNDSFSSKGARSAAL